MSIASPRLIFAALHTVEASAKVKLWVKGCKYSYPVGVRNNQLVSAGYGLYTGVQSYAIYWTSLYACSKVCNCAKGLYFNVIVLHALAAMPLFFVMIPSYFMYGLNSHSTIYRTALVAEQLDSLKLVWPIRFLVSIWSHYIYCLNSYSTAIGWY